VIALIEAVQRTRIAGAILDVVEHLLRFAAGESLLLVDSARRY